MNRKAYWSAFEAYLQETGNDDIVLIPHRERDLFKHIEIVGVPAEPPGSLRVWPHFAVVVSIRGSKKKGRLAGNRVQLVLPQRSFFERLLGAKPAIRKELPQACWISPDKDGETGHVEMWKRDNLGNPDAWDEDFAWLLRNLGLFQQVLGDHVRKLVS